MTSSKFLELITLSLTGVASSSPHHIASNSFIRIRDEGSGCFHSESKTYEWTLEGDGYHWNSRFVSCDKVDGLRKQILACTTQPADLLAQIGVTPKTVAAHREEFLDVAWPEAHVEASGKRPELPPEVEALLKYESIAPHALAELTGENWSSTEHREFSVELSGEPAIKIRSTGVVPWKLPWKIEVGTRTWTCNDITISKALSELADPNGPNAPLLDGTHYWTNEFWKDARFWGRFVGREIDTAFSMKQFSAIAGYKLAMDSFRVEKVQTGQINGQPEALFMQISTRYPSLLDAARWWNLFSDGKPTSVWDDFIAVYDAAQSCVEKQAWLKEWKLAGETRTLELQAVGRTGTAETMMDLFVVPPWKGAGFQGLPEFEILLRRNDRWCGTVYLSSKESGALIETAHAGPGEHWFDKLEFSFHPKNPFYGRVNAAGNFEMRSM